MLHDGCWKRYGSIAFKWSRLSSLSSPVLRILLNSKYMGHIMTKVSVISLIPNRYPGVSTEWVEFLPAAGSTRKKYYNSSI